MNRWQDFATFKSMSTESIPPCKLDFSGVILILRRFKCRVQKLLYICEHSKTSTNGIYMLCFVKNGKLCKSVLITIKFLNELQTAARVPTAPLVFLPLNRNTRKTFSISYLFINFVFLPLNYALVLHNLHNCIILTFL